MVGFVEKNDQKPPAPETNDASSFSSNSPPGVVADVGSESQPLRVKISLEGRQIVVSSDNKPPLGLKLAKKQPFLNKIAAVMAQATPRTPATAHHKVNSVVRRRLIEARPHPYQLQFQPPQYHHYHQQQPPMPDKLKASNFAAMFIKIGSWQRTAMNEGELVAKFYYAKKRIVWEVLDGALKSKIEMQWSDIEGIKATISHDDLSAPGVLELELNQPPQFLREKNPQPRTHTLWKQSEDFTGGQAPMCRRHLVKFPGGVLNKPYEKLLQCDPRLLELSRRPFPRMESPYFYPESTSNVTTYNDGIPFNPVSTGEAHSSYSRMLQQYFSPLPPPAPPSSFLASPLHHLVQNPSPLHSLLGSNPPLLPLSGNFQPPPGVAAGFPPLSDGRLAAAYENLVNDNRHWHRGTPSTVENSNIIYSRGQDQIQRLPPFPNPSAAAPQAFPASPTATANYGVAAPNTENTLDDIRRLLQWDSRSLSLNQRPGPMMSSYAEPYSAEINAPGNSGQNAQLQQQQQLQYKPEEHFHGANFRADGGLLCPQPLHSFPPHSLEDENAMMPLPDDDDDPNYALSYGGYGTQPQQ